VSFRNNILWNLVGQGAPLLAALFAMPVLIARLGTERFGLMAIGWMLIGYFSLFDFGLGRALTQLVARYRAERRDADVPAVMWTALAAMALLGVAAGLALFLLAPWMVRTALHVPAALHADAVLGFRLIAPAIPFVVFATGLRGVLEAQHAFRLLNLIRTPIGVLTFAGPLLVLPYTTDFAAIAGVLALIRVATTAAMAWACVRAVPGFTQVAFDRRTLPALLRFGGWMTVSNVIGPLMVNMDRFVIGAVLSLSAVAYYTTPYEMITRLLVVPGAIAGVCFPLFAHFADDPRAARAMFWKSVRYTLLFMLAACGVALVFAHDILRLWLGAEFADGGARVLQWLAVGVAINGLAHIPFAFVQGIGDARATALFHLLELALYLPLLFGLLHLFGIAGAAIAWCARVTLDCVLLFAYAQRRLERAA
jgi:O-antigen/teichoic acid export membrane protein